MSKFDGDLKRLEEVMEKTQILTVETVTRWMYNCTERELPPFYALPLMKALVDRLYDDYKNGPNYDYVDSILYQKIKEFVTKRFDAEMKELGDD